MKLVGRSLAVLLALVMLSACGSNGYKPQGYVNDTVSDEEFYHYTQTQRQEYLDSLRKDDLITKLKKDTEYMLGRPVPYGTGEMSYTRMWDRELNLIHVAQGHRTGTFGMNMSGVVTFMGDVGPDGAPNGKIRMEKDGRGVTVPVVISANVSNQETLGRMLLSIGGSMATASVNGYWAAHTSRCGNGGCGNITLNNSSGSLSQSVSTADTAVQVGSDTSFVFGCETGHCQAAQE